MKIVSPPLSPKLTFWEDGKTKFPVLMRRLRLPPKPWTKSPPMCHTSLMCNMVSSQNIRASLQLSLLKNIDRFDNSEEGGNFLLLCMLWLFLSNLNRWVTDRGLEFCGCYSRNMVVRLLVPWKHVCLPFIDGHVAAHWHICLETHKFDIWEYFELSCI